MKSLNLCIDIDGTVTEPYYWLSKANEYFNTNIKPKDVTIYEIPELLGIEVDDYNQFYNSFGKSLHMEAKVRFGAKEVISKLYENHQIHFVTARKNEMLDISLEWLTRHEIPLDSITMVGSNDKVFKAILLASDLFIEDRYDNAIQLSQAGFDVLLIDCTYNQGSLPSNVMRVKSWHQIVKIVENHALQQDMFKLAL